MNHYEALGVDEKATEEEIKKAFRALSMKNHPDLKPGDAEAEKRFKRAAEAYHVLGDPQLRADYDGLDLDLLTILSEVFKR